ncbi:MAG TPA: hypothetical protein EYQ85_07305 [Candidatus Poseidoniales archaeon]|jgi:hypothetical protein|nr:MAG: hypothetical protein CXT68_03760 [Euryarchaeota archaeon]HIF17038.1 hypothetical protein [Candidatus Poseidoniales archaeon]
MPSVIDPVATIATSALLSGIAFSGDGEYIAWGEVEESFHLANVDGSNKITIETDGAPGPIAALSKDRFIIGMSDGDLHMISTDGEIIWSHEVASGCDLLEVSKSGGLIALIDGGRRLHLLDSHGRILFTSKDSELNFVVVDRTGRCVAVADDHGNVTVYDRTGETRFTRQPSGSVAERITAIAYQADGNLVIAKETLGLAANDENELEAEWWTPLGNKIWTAELSARCDAITSHSRGCWLAQYDGRILKASIDKEPEQIWKSTYSVQCLATINDDLLVASWFNLFRIPDKGMEDEPAWQVEHAGIVEHLAINEAGDRIAIGGEDQNDYTDSEPILILDANATPREMEVVHQDDPWTADLQMDDGSEVEEIDIYADDQTAISGLLTEEERGQIESGGSEQSQSNLLAMLSGDLDIEEMAGSQIDTDLLLSGLEEESKITNIPPVSDAGFDQIIELGKDGTATALLDGSKSFDPDGMVVGWTWKDRSGKTIGETDKIKVKLNVGTHHFELTVKDNDGATTTDTTTVIVE